MKVSFSRNLFGICWRRFVFSLLIISALFLVGCGGGGNSPSSPTVDVSGTVMGEICPTTSLPGTPSISGVYSGNATASVYFGAPIASGGTAIPISYYIAKSDPGNIVATGTSSYDPITVNGLTNGTSYTFTVQAVNCIGAGLASGPSTPITPSTVPSEPISVAATRGISQASVEFMPPNDNGGAAIMNYIVTSTPGGITTIGFESPIVINGLQSGIPYTFTVAAQNISGYGSESPPSNPVVPGGSPNGAVATAENGAASVAFIPPTETGGVTISSYTATSSPDGKSVTGVSSPIRIDGLTNNTAYTFTVTANYLDGLKAVSLPSKSVIPIGHPGPYFVNSNTGSDVNPGTSGMPFKTITYALAVAAGLRKSNAVNVEAGIYSDVTGERFPIRLVNNVDLVGAGSANTILDGAGYGITTINFRSVVTLEVPANVTANISGFTIAGTNAWQRSNFFNALAIIDSANVTFANNVLIPIPSLASDGLWIVGKSNVTLTGNTIAGTGWNRGFGALLILSEHESPQVVARSNTISAASDMAIAIWGGYANSPVVDLGTSVDPGNNTIVGPTTGAGLYMRAVSNWVYASGNVWNSNMQGSDASGSYGVGTIAINPAPLGSGSNYLIETGYPSAGLQF